MAKHDWHWPSNIALSHFDGLLYILVHELVMREIFLFFPSFLNVVVKEIKPKDQYYYSFLRQLDSLDFIGGFENAGLSTTWLVITMSLLFTKKKKK